MTMIEPADIHLAPNLAAVIQLLENVELPTSDLTNAHMSDFFYAGPAANPQGIVGVEFHGSHALLRSLAVSPEHRSQGLGRRLVERAEQHARVHDAVSIYLLTTTAERFFRSRGYVDVPRDSAPSDIRSTPEFSTLCPSSSAFLMKRL